MAPPQLFINTKTLELEKQPENEKRDGSEDLEPANKQEQEAEKEEKGDNNDSHDPDEDANGMDEKFPIFNYIFSLVFCLFTSLAFALVGVSFKKND